MTDIEDLARCALKTGLEIHRDLGPGLLESAYEALMAAPYKMPVEKIAERVGRSVKYIYDRV